MKLSISNIIYGCLTAVIGLCMASCADDEPGQTTYYTETHHRVAVMCSQEWMSDWKSTASWALENVVKAQTGQSERIAIDIDWFDEDAPDIADKAYEMARSGEYDMIIGPTTSALTYKIAQKVEGKIPMLLPITTSTELQRIYGGHNGLWFFTQSDIAQCEILLTQAKISEFDHVSLLTSDDEYGRSFKDWFAYLAIELGLTVDESIIYTNESDLSDAVRQLNDRKGWYDKALIFAPSDEADVIAFDREIGKLKSGLGEHEALHFPKVLCSDVVNSPKVKGKVSNLEYEGISPSADPRSGWVAACMGRKGNEPINGEAQFYDALLLASYALFAQREGEVLNDAIMRIVDGRDGSLCDGWTAADMQSTFSRLAAGENPDIRGVTGDWTWDAKHHNSVTGTFYAHWVYDEGKFNTLEYLTMNGADGSISSIQAWEWASTHRQTFDSNQKDFTYPELKDRYAVVIGGSDTWINYRHQSDALAMYQMLKSVGYDDDHIILIMEDNIAYNPNNSIPGNVRVTPEGENLYHDVTVDYKLSEIKVDDLADIMTGNASAQLPHVITPGANDNIFMFWGGHGSRNTLMWGSFDFVYGADMNKLVARLHDEGRYRKLMFVLDACYSGTIGEAIEGIPGALVFTAAHANEPSKADIYDNDMNVWLSNGFTRTFRDNVSANPDITLRDLYYETVRGTKGSHPHIYNAGNYGNMYRETLHEYL